MDEVTAYKKRWFKDKKDCVEVIRCKDCVYWNSLNGFGCYMDGRDTDENDFCSWGKGKEA